jgi:hypothetical protein
MHVRGRSRTSANSAGRSSFSQTIAVTPGATYEIGGWGSHGKAGFGPIPDRLILDIGGSANRVMAVWNFLAGSTPSDFTRFRRLYTAGPGETIGDVHVRTRTGFVPALVR